MANSTLARCWRAIVSTLTPGFRLSQQDKINEARMQEIYDKFIKTKDPETKTLLWKKYSVLHSQRSPALVAYIEKKKGLYREQLDQYN